MTSHTIVKEVTYRTMWDLSVVESMIFVVSTTCTSVVAWVVSVAVIHGPAAVPTEGGRTHDAVHAGTSHVFLYGISAPGTLECGHLDRRGDRTSVYEPCCLCEELSVVSGLSAGHWPMWGLLARVTPGGIKKITYRHQDKEDHI